MTRDEPVSIRRILAAATVALALVAVATWPVRGRAAPAVQAGQTPTNPLAPTIAISSATPIACDQTAVGNTTGAATLTGPERVYSLNLAEARDVDALLSGLSSDLDLLLLTGSNPASCIAFGDNAINTRALAAGTYYLVVDGFEGASGPFHLSVWCPLAVTATPTPTVTPTLTPRPVLHIRYLPLLLHSLETRR